MHQLRHMHQLKHMQKQVFQEKKSIDDIPLARRILASNQKRCMQGKMIYTFWPPTYSYVSFGAI